jgi:peptide/nickel transport system substrate-binding protein
MLGASAKAGVGAAGLALVGCGDDDDDDAVTQAPASTPDDQADQAADQAVDQADDQAEPVDEPEDQAEDQAVGELKRGGTFNNTIAGLSSGNPPTLDPHGANISFLQAIPAGYHYSRLLRFTAVPGTYSSNYGDLTPDAAESLPEIIDPQTYVYTIRDNIFFHDVAPVSGRKLTAEDFVSSEARFREESGNRINWSTAVTSATAPDARTFRLDLNFPFAPMASLTASHEHLRAIPHEIEDDGSVENRPIGSGPWVFDSFTPDVGLTWKANPNYFLEGFPIMDGVNSSVVNDASTIIANLASGALDGTPLTGLPFESVVKAQLPDLDFVTGTETTYNAVYFDFSKPPWGDARVRQALSMAMDRDGILNIVDETGPGSYQTALPKLDPFWLDPRGSEFGENAKFFMRDLQAAQQLMDAAGIGDGIDMKVISALAVYGAGFGQRIELILSTIADAGFRAEIDDFEYGTYITTVFGGAFPDDATGVAIAPVKGNTFEPDDNLFAIYHPDSGRHNYGPGPGDISENPDLLALFDEQRADLDADNRVETIKEIQRIMAEQMYIVPWPAVPQIYASQTYMQDFTARQGYAAGTSYIPFAAKNA